MPTLMNFEQAEQWMMEQRCIETKCRRCNGWGVRTYGSTATWRGGAGGMTITSDVCDWCWGSGDDNRKWPSHRLLRMSASQ